MNSALENFIYNNPIWLWGSLLTIIVVSLTFLGAFLIRHYFQNEILKSHTQIGLGILIILTTAYSVLIALIALGTLDIYRHTDNLVVEEASIVGNLMRDSVGFPASVGNAMRADINDYLTAVITIDWPAQQTGDISSAKFKGWDALIHLADVLTSFDAKTRSELIIQEDAFTMLNHLYDLRRARVLNSQSAIPSVTWWIIGWGGAIILLYCNLLATRSFVLQLILLGLAATSLSLVIVVIVALDRPFKGTLSIAPTAFIHVQNNLIELKEHLHVQ